MKRDLAFTTERARWRAEPEEAEPGHRERGSAPRAVARTLEEHGVVYALVGSSAAVAQGADEDCQAFELCYRKQWENCECLVRALEQLGNLPRDRAAPLAVDFFLADRPFLLLAPGKRPVVAHPEVAGLGTFDDFVGDSDVARLDGRQMLCLSVAQIVTGVRSGDGGGRGGAVDRLLELAHGGTTLPS